MSTAGGQAENLLGALGLAMSDRMGDAIVARAGHASSDAIALSALQDFLDAPTVDRLAEVLGLTSSGTVRLVDRLERAGLVTRRMGTDGRSTHVTLTAAGRRAGHAVAATRRDPVDVPIVRHHRVRTPAGSVPGRPRRPGPGGRTG